jgi:hypothetical protein
VSVDGFDCTARAQSWHKDVTFDVDGMTVAKANTKVEDTPIKTIVIGDAYLEKGKKDTRRTVLCLIGEKGKVRLRFSRINRCVPDQVPLSGLTKSLLRLPCQHRPIQYGTAICWTSLAHARCSCSCSTVLCQAGTGGTAKEKRHEAEDKDKPLHRIDAVNGWTAIVPRR